MAACGMILIGGVNGPRNEVMFISYTARHVWRCRVVILTQETDY